MQPRRRELAIPYAHEVWPAYSPVVAARSRIGNEHALQSLCHTTIQRQTTTASESELLTA